MDGKNLVPCGRLLFEKLIAHSASQQITRLLWSPKFHYRVHKNLPYVYIRSQMNPIHILQPYFSNIHCNIILLSNPRAYQDAAHR
jgi:hypothetical protein